MGLLIDYRKKKPSGFTSWEVIAGLLLIGIISAVVVSKSTSTVSELALCEVYQVKAHLRYAQSRALANHADWGVSFESSSSYCLFQGDPANRRILPGQEADTVTLAHLGISGTPQTITFDGYGSPGPNDVTISTSSTGITVTAHTGYIP